MGRRAGWYGEWKNNPAVIANPDYPHPRGWPIELQRGEAVPAGRERYYKLEVGMRVRCNDAWAYHRYGIDRGMIIDTKAIKEYRNDPVIYKIMVDTHPGVWAPASCFDELWSERNACKTGKFVATIC